jgi:hypothetical protein
MLRLNIRIPWHGHCKGHSWTPDNRARRKRKTNDMKLKSNIHKVAMTALAVAVLSPALAFAGGAPKPQHERAIIKSVDMNAHTLVVTAPKHKEQTFQWNDQTKFREHFRSTTANALKEGEPVRLTYRSGDATPVLKRVYITPGKHAAKNTSSTGSKGV